MHAREVQCCKQSLIGGAFKQTKKNDLFLFVDEFLQMTREGVGSLEAGVMCGCELPSTGARNPIQVLLWHEVLLTAKPSLKLNGSAEW